MHHAEHIGLCINVASHLIRRRVDSFSNRRGLTGIQSRILSYIAGAKDQAIFQRDIEQRFGIRRSSVTSVISNLEQNGFLLRQAVPGDARLKKLVLTEKGIAADRELSCSIQEFEQSLADYFSSEEQQTLLALLHRLIDGLGGPAACDSSGASDRQEAADASRGAPRDGN